MGFISVMKSIGGALNRGLKATKIASTLAPALGTMIGQPGLGALASGALRNAGYVKGGRILKAPGMKRGGRVRKPKRGKKKK